MDTVREMMKRGQISMKFFTDVMGSQMSTRHRCRGDARMMRRLPYVYQWHPQKNGWVYFSEVREYF